jgi:hypothetical protein
MRSSSGTPNASVLPVPVRAWPMRSAPVSAIGMVSSWMGNACSMPIALRALAVSGDAPSSANVDRTEPFDRLDRVGALAAAR